MAALEEGNRNRQAELTAYAELDNIAEEDEQEPPGWYIFRIICRNLTLRSMFRYDCDETNATLRSVKDMRSVVDGTLLYIAVL